MQPAVLIQRFGAEQHRSGRELHRLRSHRDGDEEVGALFADQQVPRLDPSGAAVVRAEDPVPPQQPADLQRLGPQRQRGFWVVRLHLNRGVAPAGVLRQPWLGGRLLRQEAVVPRGIGVPGQRHAGAVAADAVACPHPVATRA